MMTCEYCGKEWEVKLSDQVFLFCIGCYNDGMIKLRDENRKKNEVKT